VVVEATPPQPTALLPTLEGPSGSPVVDQELVCISQGRVGLVDRQVQVRQVVLLRPTEDQVVVVVVALLLRMVVVAVVLAY
jgi:hypothetical protein